MAAIRILVVDDSLVIRMVLSDTLSKDPDLEVVATASDGRIALEKISQMHPDVVTLDVEVPVMNGLETLAELRRLYPKLPVIMFSTLTERGAESKQGRRRGSSCFFSSIPAPGWCSPKGPQL
jgi:two-component system, chemotaxis family, protein-glutamate methylesterase/glutaminase